MPEQNPRLSLATTVQLVLGCSRPHCPSAGDTHPGRGDRKQQQPRQGKRKQKSTNKLKLITQVPALTSSILLLLSLRQRRFPAQEGSLAAARVHREEGERVCFAGEANTFLQLISIALYLPAAARNLAPQIRQAAFPILPIPPAGKVWQLSVFWSWGQQRCAADKCVAKSHGFSQEVPRCGSWPWGWQARQSRHTGSAHICSDPTAWCSRRVARAGAGLHPSASFQIHPSSPSFLPPPPRL